MGNNEITSFSFTLRTLVPIKMTIRRESRLEPVLLHCIFLFLPSVCPILFDLALRSARPTSHRTNETTFPRFALLHRIKATNAPANGKRGKTYISRDNRADNRRRYEERSPRRTGPTWKFKNLCNSGNTCRAEYASSGRLPKIE